MLDMYHICIELLTHAYLLVGGIALIELLPRMLLRAFVGKSNFLRQVLIMFSTAQQAYIEALLPTYAKEGYQYYVAYSHTVVGSGYYTPTDPDLYVIFSKEAISAQDAYTYDIQDDSIIVTVRSSNYSSSSSAVNTDRVVVEEYSAQTLTIDQYEHIYTNADFESYALQPDYYLSSGGETNVQIQTLTFVVIALFLFVALRKLWHKR